MNQLIALSGTFINSHKAPTRSQPRCTHGQHGRATSGSWKVKHKGTAAGRAYMKAAELVGEIACVKKKRNS